MESDQLSQDHLFSSVYDQITISAEPSNDEKSIDEFESKLNLLTCDIIQNKTIQRVLIISASAQHKKKAFFLTGKEFKFKSTYICLRIKITVFYVL